MSRRTRGLTLIETLIMGGIVLLIAILVLPLVQGARIAANEGEAVDLLRAVHQVYRDRQQAEPKSPPPMTWIAEKLEETYPDCALSSSRNGRPLIQYHGYLIGPCYADDGRALAGAFYAWPAQVEVSGTAAFFIDNQGVVFFSHNLQKRYSGLAMAPHQDAARPRDGRKPEPPLAGVNRESNSRKYSGGFIGADNQRWDFLQT